MQLIQPWWQAILFEKAKMYCKLGPAVFQRGLDDVSANDPPSRQRGDMNGTTPIHKAK